MNGILAQGGITTPNAGNGCGWVDLDSVVDALRSGWLDHPDRKQRFEVHHTPTHASWLNQIELFFSILSRRLLRRGEFESVDQLAAKVVAFIENYNHNAKPFRWTYQGKPLKSA